MFSMLLGVGIATWFVLLYPILIRQLAVRPGPQDEPLLLPMILVGVFAFMPLVFVIPREDGSAVLDEGLTASNIVTLALTGITGLYMAYKLASNRRIALLPFSLPYLPFTLMIVFDGFSALWSIVPAYTLYRTVELSIFYLATILIFDRADIGRRMPQILALFIVGWLLAVAPIILQNLVGGTIFSAAKNNMMPLVCAALMLLALFKPGTRHRKAYFTLGVVGFTIAGSAASTGALVAALGPAMLIASPRPGYRVFGYATAALAVLVFLVLMLGLSYFPDLVDLLSAILQKPAVELTNATGRTTFWPTFIAATRDHVFGSGFSAADRFVQLLIPTDALADSLGKDKIFITSSHNMFLSAWAGTGVVGISFAAVVLGSAIQWGLKLDRQGARFVVAVVLMLALNGMTTPGIFQDWTVNTLAFVAILAYARIGATKWVPHSVRVRTADPIAVGPRWRVT